LPALTADDTLVWRSINTIRALAMDAVEAAQSGHPGTPMALAPAAWVLWTRHLRHDPTDPAWPNRDRFVLSCGHASMLLYGLLHLTGYDLPLDEIRRFRQWGSKTPGHPEHGHTPGVETTTGPLGQGVGNAVGMAMAERLLAERFNRPGHSVVDHRTWAFVSDGDLMEGVASEACSLAGHLALGKLALVYDDNRITIDGETTLSFSEEVGTRFEGYGWRVLRVEDGNDILALDRAYAEVRESADQPTLIILRTVIADPAPTKRNTAEAHGAPLGRDEVARTKQILGWPDEPFHVPTEVAEEATRIRARGSAMREEWQAAHAAWTASHADLAAQLASALSGRLTLDWSAVLPRFAAGPALATRQASSKVLEALAGVVPTLAGGSADLAGSTGVNVKGQTSFAPGRAGRGIAFGVREHAMASVMNGLGLHGGVRPYGSTFLVFADYMKPAIRLAALMGVPAIYVFTHDSIGLGEDGPTHQPIEHLAMLRSIPNLRVIRPADAAETAEAWRAAIERTDGPTALVLTRQKLPTFDRAAAGMGAAEGTRRGGYVLFEPDAAPRVILIATGSEVSLALESARRLAADGLPARVVSLPSWELFRAQPAEYRESVLPSVVRARVSVEAATRFGWREWVTDDGESIGIDHFGASAPAERLFQEFGFTPDAVVQAVRRVTSRRS
jgi:transketolase